MAPQSSIPPSLPPSVEEAYRRKCVQLKQRTAEVEEENDATRVRLLRIQRQVKKLRVERAFLLEQLSKRTSTNVEDSEGSPSPPPTPTAKPLRTKRGHRKGPTLQQLERGSERLSGSLANAASALSPSSEAFSHTQGDTQATNASSSRANGVSKPPKRPVSAFELYCNETRPSLTGKDSDPELNVEEELARGWKDLPETEKEEYQAKYDQELAKYQKDKEAYSQKSKAEVKAEKAKSPERAVAETQDEDVEMTNYDTEEQEPEAAADEKAEE